MKTSLMEGASHDRICLACLLIVVFSYAKGNLTSGCYKWWHAMYLQQTLLSIHDKTNLKACEINLRMNSLKKINE